MTKVIIDGKELDVPPEFTLLQACEAAGAEMRGLIRHFHYEIEKRIAALSGKP